MLLCSVSEDWGMAYIGLPFSLWVQTTSVTLIEPCDTFRQFIMLAFQFHGEVILIIFRFIRTLLTFEQKEADKR